MNEDQTNNDMTTQQASVNKNVIIIVFLLACLLTGWFVFILFFNHPAKNNPPQQQASLTCAKVPQQFCAEIACVGADKGEGSCGANTFCCKVINQPLATQNQATLVSDVKSVQLKNFDQAALTKIASDLHVFNNPNALFNNVQGELTKGLITSVTIRITDLSGAPLYRHDDTVTNPADKADSAYGDTFDSRNGHLTIFLYYSDNLLRKTTTDALTNMVWHTTLLSLYQLVNQPTAAPDQVNAQNSFINSHMPIVPFILTKSS